MARLTAGELPQPTFTSRHVHDLTNRILSEPQFKRPSKPWLQRGFDWLSKELDRILNAFVNGGATTVLAWLIAAVAVAVAAILLRRFFRRVQRDPGVHSESPPRRRWNAADWRSEAELHRRAGEWREAIRCSYRALVASLAERGIVEEVPGRTTREYEDLVKDRLPAISSEFGTATELFEAVWYGDAATNESDEERFRELGDRVLAMAKRG